MDENVKEQDEIKQDNIVEDDNNDNKEEKLSEEDIKKLRGDYIDEIIKEEIDKLDKEEDEYEVDPKTIEELINKINTPTIPKARFDEVNNRLKKAEAILNELEKNNKNIINEKDNNINELSSEKQDDLNSIIKEISKKNKEYFEAIIDGDDEEAEKLALEIEQLREKKIEYKAALIAENKIKEFKEIEARNNEINEAVKYAEKIVEQYPFFNENEEAVDIFSAIRDYYISKGNNRIKAMDIALQKVISLYNIDNNTNNNNNLKNIEEEKIKNIERKIKLANRQPPRLGGVGNRSSGSLIPTNIEEMDDEEFAKLSQAERRRLRGDIV